MIQIFGVGDCSLFGSIFAENNEQCIIIIFIYITLNLNRWGSKHSNNIQGDASYHKLKHARGRGIPLNTISTFINWIISFHYHHYTNFCSPKIFLINPIIELVVFHQTFLSNSNYLILLFFNIKILCVVVREEIVCHELK